MIGSLPPSVVFVRISAGPIAAIAIASGVLLLLPIGAWDGRAPRAWLAHAAGVASVSACALGVCATLLESFAAASLHVIPRAPNIAYMATLIPLSGVLAWIVGFVGTVGRSSWNMMEGSAVRPAFVWPYLAALAGGVILGGLLLIERATVDLMYEWLALWPFACIGFAARLRWWAGTQVRHRKSLAGLALIVVGTIFAAAVYGFNVVGV